MSVSRRSFIAVAGSAVAIPALIRDVKAQAQVTLKVHHFLPPVANFPAKVLVPWTKKVEQASGGRIAFQVFPSMQLGGTPPQLYDQARDGVADIIWTLPGSTPGRFPASEVFELPFICDAKGAVNAKAAQEYATKHMADETKDVKLLCYWVHDGGLIHSKKPVPNFEALKGQKLRFPTRLAGEGLKAAGVNAIGMPVPQVPESLAQGVIDGAVVPWEVVPSIKVHELVKNHIAIPGSPTFYAASFFLAMNKAKYDSLPDDLKKIIDDTTGMALATDAGKMWDDAGAEVEKMVMGRSGSQISALSPEDVAKWRKACEPVTESWIKQMKDKGLDGQKLIDEARALLKKHGGTA